tara:strand:+ start:53 stop:394 length:342 start_codon:yes stop_codon:yes gene_type:complete
MAKMTREEKEEKLADLIYNDNKEWRRTKERYEENWEAQPDRFLFDETKPSEWNDEEEQFYKAKWRESGIRNNYGIMELDDGELDSALKYEITNQIEKGTLGYGKKKAKGVKLI